MYSENLSFDFVLPLPEKQYLVDLCTKQSVNGLQHYFGCTPLEALEYVEKRWELLKEHGFDYTAIYGQQLSLRQVINTFLMAKYPVNIPKLFNAVGVK